MTKICFNLFVVFFFHEAIRSGHSFVLHSFNLYIYIRTTITHTYILPLIIYYTLNILHTSSPIKYTVYITSFPCISFNILSRHSLKHNIKY
jgi:hypothetical protein